MFEHYQEKIKMSKLLKSFRDLTLTQQVMDGDEAPSALNPNSFDDLFVYRNRWGYSWRFLKG
jgi:hypothetical protein